MNDIQIILIEDNQDDAELTKLALESLNTAGKVHWFQDGEEALDYILKRGKYAHARFDDQLKVVFLDLKLPKMNGWEILAAIKSNKATKTLPVVILTSSNHIQDIKKSYELGANSYIVKPVLYEQFQEVLKTIGYYWGGLNKQISI